MTRTRALAMTAALALLAAPALATPIGPGAFGAFQLVESFEGVPVGPNAQIGMGVSLLEPGLVGAYSFASGLELTDPVPNPGVLNQGAFIHDFARGADVTNNWGAGRVVNDAGDVPFGDAYLGAFHPTGTGTASVEFSFAVPIDRVGAYVSGASGESVTMQVFDGSGTLLETVNAGTVPLGSWATNFLGVEQAGRIARVVFSGADFGLDALTFENDPLLVPEPSTLSALACGLVGLWGLAAIGRGRAAVPSRVQTLR